jgi:hypothetical protein
MRDVRATTGNQASLGAFPSAGLFERGVEQVEGERVRVVVTEA